MSIVVVAAITSQLGQVVERYSYNAYGKQAVLADNGVVAYKPSDYGQFVGFTGRYHDWETGLQYFRARYFDNLLGRFISRDPLEYVSGLSTYSGYYVPNGIDPYGLADAPVSPRNPIPPPRPPVSDPEWRDHKPVAGDPLAGNGEQMVGYFYSNEMTNYDWMHNKDPVNSGLRNARGAVNDFKATYFEGAASISELLDQAQKACDNSGKAKRCFRVLFIDAHGGTGDGFRFGDNGIDVVSTVNLNGQPLDSKGQPRDDGGQFGRMIKGSMCIECTIVILGCQAYNKPLIERIAKVTGCNVIAGVGDTVTQGRKKGGFTFGTPAEELHITNKNDFIKTTPSGVVTSLGTTLTPTLTSP